MMISGTITDDSGGAMPGVTVTATNIATSATRTAVSNAAGYYQVALLPPALYRVEATLDGFQPVRRERILVNIGTDVTGTTALGNDFSQPTGNAGLAVARGRFVSFPGSHVELVAGSLAARLAAHESGYAMVTGTVLNGTLTPAGWAAYFLEHTPALPGRLSRSAVACVVTAVSASYFRVFGTNKEVKRMRSFSLAPWRLAILMVLFGTFVHMACVATFAVVPFLKPESLGSVSGIVGAGGNAGAVAAGRPLGARTFGIIGSSVCVYWAGMALNDYADAPVDAAEMDSGRMALEAADGRPASQAPAEDDDAVAGVEAPEAGIESVEFADHGVSGWTDVADQPMYSALMLAVPAEIAGTVEASVDPGFRALMSELHTDTHILNALVYRHFQGALVTGDLSVPVTGVSIDSRTLIVGDAFFAIAGHRLDGHAFLGEAAGRGAACIVVHALPDDVPASVPVVLVDDTTRALGRLAAWHRAKFAVPVVAITGSIGKTTAKELTASVLGTRWHVLKPASSFNNQWGLPLTLLRLGPEHQRTGAPIVYTSADSVFQIAAHEGIVPVAQLYKWCNVAYDLAVKGLGLGRVIARPFIGLPGSFQRTPNRHDYAMPPTGETLLDRLTQAKQPVVAIGKIEDLFAGRGITRALHTASDDEGMDHVLTQMDAVGQGLLFANLVDAASRTTFGRPASGAEATAMTPRKAPNTRAVERSNGSMPAACPPARHGTWRFAIPSRTSRSAARVWASSTFAPARPACSSEVARAFVRADYSTATEASPSSTVCTGRAARGSSSIHAASAGPIRR